MGALSSLSLFGMETLSVDFSEGMGALVPLEATHWEVKGTGDEAILALIQKGEQRGGVRRPTEFVLTEGRSWANYEVRVRVQSKMPDSVKGRDVVVIFGYKDFDHFYYAHLCWESNNKTHNIIMKVHGDARTVIMNENLPEARLSAGWHDVRVTHATDGTIRVYMDDLETPLMTAEDPDYPAGAVGFGSFDDVAEFDDFVVTGEHPEVAITAIDLRKSDGAPLALHFSSALGIPCQIQSSDNLSTWEDEGASMNDGAGQDYLRVLPTRLENALFFRVFAELPTLPKF